MIELYYFDESGFSQKSNLPYGWSEKGVSIECTAYLNSKKFNVLGFLSRQGKVVYHEVECTVNTDIVIEAFEKFAKELSVNKQTIVYVDNASNSHIGKIYKPCLVMGRAIQLRD